MPTEAASAPAVSSSEPRKSRVEWEGMENTDQRCHSQLGVRRAWVAGMVCWVPDEKRAFVEARVAEVKDGAVTVILEVDGDETEQRQCSLQELLPRVVGLTCKSNMDELPELNKATVLQNVEMLFYQSQSAVPGVGQTAIYSTVGPVLIAMNPFTELPIYGREWISAYSSAGGALPAAQKRLGPHCYGTAEEAYQGLRAIRHQTVVTCGESGAGKTVTTKKMLQYLCEVGCDAEGQSGADPEQIIEANVLIEAFGNSKTTRNSNSSRFGKFTQVRFTEKYTVEGCEIEHYLLERSRVVAQGRWERNYHVFYQLCRSPEAALYGLNGGPEAFEYTKCGAAEEGFDDARDFEELCLGMSKAGFSAEAQQDIFEAAASVLHLGNIAFEGDADESQVKPETMDALSQACKLLGVEVEALSTALTTKFVKDIKTPLSAEKAKAQCQAVAKMVYSRLFDRIIRNINARLSKRRAMEDTSSGGATIGLLDIFGFEDMLINGFEQMLINLTNERIQNLFNSIMFERELEAYRKEGITDAFEDIPSNMKCIQLFSQAKPPGILKLLADQCNVTGESGDGERFVDVLNRAFKHHKHYKVCTPQNFREVTNQKISAVDRKLMPERTYKECFFVEHYAGSVMYTVQEFVSKSRDTLLPHLADVLRHSSKPSMQQMFPSEAQAPRGSSKESTVGDKFLKQLEFLAGSLERGACLFVRCIKSNPKMLPGRVHRPLVMEQLNCSGVVAALEMRNRGFPDRIDFRAFCDEFFVLEDRHAGQFEVLQRCQLIMRDFIDVSLESGSTAPYAFGHTKIFMKGNVLHKLRNIKEVKLRHFANFVRQRWRVFQGTERIKHVEDSWKHLQAIQATAREQGVHELRSVNHELQQCEALIRPVLASLEEARVLHKNDVPKIGAALNRYAQELPKFRSKVDVAAARIEEVAASKQLMDQILLKRLRRAAEDADNFAERLAAVEKECASCDDAANSAEREECCTICSAARNKLETLRDTKLPEAHRLGSVGLGLDLESDLKKTLSLKKMPTSSFESEDLVPSITELLQEISLKVESAEKLGHSISGVRREFLRAAAEQKERIAGARATLKELQEESRQYITEGYNGIGEVFDDAWREHDTLEELQDLAQNKDAFLASVAQFEWCVEIVKSQIQKCREWLLRHREAEMSKLAAVRTQLAGHEELLRASALCAKAAKAGREELLEKQAAGAAGKSEEKLIAGLLQVEETLRSLGLTEISEEELDRLQIVDRTARDAATRKSWYSFPFGWSARANDVVPEPKRNTQLLRTIAKAPIEIGTWDVSQTSRVDSRDVERGSVKVMDKEAVPSVSAAVEALQLGILQCPEGYVIVWSKRAGHPFVVYRSDKRNEALTHFGLDEETKEKAAKEAAYSNSSRAPASFFGSRSSAKPKPAPKDDALEETQQKMGAGTDLHSCD